MHLLAIVVSNTIDKMQDLDLLEKRPFSSETHNI